MGSSPGPSIVVALLLETELVVVDAGVRIVVIGNLRQVAYSLVGLLKNGDANGHIICSFKVLSIVIFEILLLDIEEQLCIESAEMASDEGICTVIVVSDGGGGKGP